MLAAARDHEVWVLTRKNNIGPLQRALAEAGVAEKVHLVGIDPTGLALRVKGQGLPFLHWYYERWQRAAAGVAVDLDNEVDFDLVHHATFAAYWTRTGVQLAGKPFVWGPVGGGAHAPIGLWPSLGVIGGAGELARWSSRKVLARVNHARGTAKGATLVIAQNHETHFALGAPGNAMVLPHSLAVIVDQVATQDLSSRADVVFAGRLIPWKAVTLAVDTMSHLQHPDTILHVYGDGPDRGRLDRRVSSHGLESRVRIHGRVSRQRLLEAVASSQVLLHPALHDEAPLAVAEALTLGTPIVALNHAGPAAIAAHWPPAMSRLVTPTTPDATARNLARAVDTFLDEDADVERPTRRFDFVEALLEIYRSAYEATEPSPKV